MKRNHLFKLTIASVLTLASFSFAWAQSTFPGYRFTNVHRVSEFRKLQKMDAHTEVHTRTELIAKADDNRLAGLKGKTLVLEPNLMESKLDPIDYADVGRKLNQARPAIVQIPPMEEADLAKFNLMLQAMMKQHPNEVEANGFMTVRLPATMKPVDRDTFLKKLSAQTGITPTTDEKGVHFVASNKQELVFAVYAPASSTVTPGAHWAK